MFKVVEISLVIVAVSAGDGDPVLESFFFVLGFCLKVGEPRKRACRVLEIPTPPVADASDLVFDCWGRLSQHVVWLVLVSFLGIGLLVIKSLVETGLLLVALTSGTPLGI